MKGYYVKRYVMLRCVAAFYELPATFIESEIVFILGVSVSYYARIHVPLSVRLSVRLSVMSICLIINLACLSSCFHSILLTK